MMKIEMLKDQDLKFVEALLDKPGTIEVIFYVDPDFMDFSSVEMWRTVNGRTEKNPDKSEHDWMEESNVIDNSIIDYMKENALYRVEIKKRNLYDGLGQSAAGLYENFFTHDQATVLDVFKNLKKLPVGV